MLVPLLTTFEDWYCPICANLENPPPASWPPMILDDWEIRRSISQKPIIPAPGS